MIELDGMSLSIADVERVARGGEAARLSESAKGRIRRGRAVVDQTLASGEAIYGVNTGFGELSTVRIASESLRDLQERLLLSHAAGVGDPLPDEAVRTMLLLRANTLARGHSGIRVRVVERLLQLLELGLLPKVPRRGSVGASGDLAPLSHLALPIIGAGEVGSNGQWVPSEQALAEHGLEPLELEAKEGLALINGTQAMTALLALSVIDVGHLVKVADLTGAMSADAMRGTDAAFDARLHALRPHPGQVASAANLWSLMQESEIRESHRLGDVRVQDPYSIRCMPQVHGAVRDLLSDVTAKLTIEMSSVTDNPLVFPEGDIISGGNFHGEPMAFAADVLALGVAELASIAERRIEKLTNRSFSGLPPFLVEDAGLNSGFMIAQVTAAALVSESKGLAGPASVDSIPTSADKEDHVSMGMGAALKLRRVIENTTDVLAIELLAAAQGVDLLRPLRTSPPLERAVAALRRTVPTWTRDRFMAPDIGRARTTLLTELDDELTRLN